MMGCLLVDEMNEPCFGVLILCYNGLNWLPGLYDSLRVDGYKNKRIYLVDNNSSDGSQDFTRKSYPEVAILQMPRNMGYSMAYNMAMDVAFDDGCDWVVWQNTDTLVLPGWLGRMAEIAEGNPSIGVMGPVFRDWQSEEPNDFMKARHSDVVPFMSDVTHEPVDCDWVEGSALAVKRECVNSVGPLDPSLFMYWEEADFCRRALRKNWRVVIVPGSIIRHYGGGSSAQNSFNELKERNEYVYTLCDPGKPFLTNILRVMRTFPVKLKIAIYSDTPVSQLCAHSKVFVELWFYTFKWYSKWQRDRHGEHPQKLCEGQEITLP